MKKDWTYKKLGEVCEINFGTRVVRSRDAGSIYPVYGGGGATFKMDTYNREDCMVISRFGMSEECTRFVKGKFFLNDSGLTLSMKERCMIQPFMDWQILSLNNTIYSLGRGAAQKNLDTKALAEVTISYPPLSEQSRIVSRLDAAFGEIEGLKAKAEAQLREARTLFQAALTLEMKPKQGWEEKKFKDLCSFVRGPFGGSLKKNCFVPSGYAVYEQQNAIYNKFTFRYFINEDKYNSMIRFSVEPGDLIMSCSGTIGKVAIIPEGAAKGIINQALLKLSPKKVLDKYYLKYLMESSFFDDLITQHSDGAAIKNIASVAILKEITLSLPPLSVQQSIVSRLDALSEKVRELEETQKKVIAECDALKQALLREVFE